VNTDEFTRLRGKPKRRETCGGKRASREGNLRRETRFARGKPAEGNALRARETETEGNLRRETCGGKRASREGSRGGGKPKRREAEAEGSRSGGKPKRREAEAELDPTPET
jgi:hypothetical protein